MEINKVFIVGIILLIAGFILKDNLGLERYFSGQENDSQQEDNSSSLPAVTIVPGAGKVEPIAGVDTKSLKIVSLGEITDVDEEGNFSASLHQDGVTTVAAMLPDQDFGLINIVVLDEIGEAGAIELNTETTAVSLIFMTPYLITLDPNEANKTLAIIRTDESVRELAGVIEERISISEDIMEDAEYKAAFSKALESVLVKLSQ